MPRANYDALMQALIDRLPKDGQRPKLLLHCCCAPCSTAAMERLHQAFDITVYYYNPNIDTAAEHDLRARELQDFTARSGLAGEAVIRPYEPDAYLAAIRGLEQEPEGGARCQRCFALRLRQAARYAAQHGYDYFTTTLTISPLKNAALLNALGEQIGGEEGIPFLNSDFKKRGGYLRSTELSHAYGIYRQDYCGCAFSKAARDRRREQTG